MGGFCLFLESHRGWFAPGVCAAGLFKSDSLLSVVILHQYFLVNFFNEDFFRAGVGLWQLFQSYFEVLQLFMANFLFRLSYVAQGPHIQFWHKLIFKLYPCPAGTSQSFHYIKLFISSPLCCFSYRAITSVSKFIHICPISWIKEIPILNTNFVYISV